MGQLWLRKWRPALDGKLVPVASPLLWIRAQVDPFSPGPCSPQRVRGCGLKPSVSPLALLNSGMSELSAGARQARAQAPSNCLGGVACAGVGNG